MDESDTDRTRRRVRRAGTWAIVIGAGLALAGTIPSVYLAPGVPCLMRVPFDGLWRSPWHDPLMELVIGLPFLVFIGVWGVGLLTTGVGVRRCREWARRAMRGLLWFWIIYAACLAGGVWIHALVAAGDKADRAGHLLFVPVAMFYLYLARRCVRFFGRSEVREVCGLSAYGGGRARVRARWLLALVYGVGVAPSVVAYAAWWHVSSRRLGRDLARLERSGAVLDYPAWTPPTPRDEDNAADLLRQAFSLMDAADSVVRAAEPAPPPHPRRPRSKDWRSVLGETEWDTRHVEYARGVLRHYAEALVVLVEAAEKQTAHFHWDYSQRGAMATPELARLEDADRILELATRFAIMTGDDAAAAMQMRVALGLARFPSDPLYAADIRRIRGIRTVVWNVERLLRRGPVAPSVLVGLDGPFDQARQGLDFARVVGAERARWLSYRDDLLAGRWREFATVAADARYKRIGLDRAPALYGGPVERAIARPAVRIAFVVMLRHYDRVLDALAAPSWQAAPALARLERDAVPRDLPFYADRFSGLPPVPGGCYEAGRFTYVYLRCDALVDAARIGLALKRFEAETGRRLDRPADLAPAWLSAVPVDPFAGGDFLIRSADGAVTVYSVGPDQADDGGEVRYVDDVCGSPRDVGVRFGE